MSATSGLGMAYSRVSARCVVQWRAECGVPGLSLGAQMCWGKVGRVCNCVPLARRWTDQALARLWPQIDGIPRLPPSTGDR